MCAHGGPRRLSSVTPSVPRGPALSCSRKAAADASLCARPGRNRKARVPLPATALCRRRTCRASACVAQHSTMPSAPLDKACSVVHSASCGRSGETSARRARPMPAAAQAGAWQACGGATSSIHLSSASMRVSAGSRNEHSPKPLPSARISVSAPRGQPPPGSSASRRAKPLGMPGRAAPARVLPRQTSGRIRTSSKETALCISVSPCVGRRLARAEKERVSLPGGDEPRSEGVRTNTKIVSGRTPVKCLGRVLNHSSGRMIENTP